MMRITWETETLGVLSGLFEDDRVLPYTEALIKLGFTPEVTHE